MTALGRLERVDLRTAWLGEATHFTPWLAREENLSLLSQTLGLELELVAQEQRVGPFRADILCRDAFDDAFVLIENQLERTDHGHLGQLLTYAAGLHAATVVWIAAQVTEEHRAAITWLNEITAQTFRFFAVEVELWRIGESPAAPKFNVVAKPNDWSRQVTAAAKAADQSLTPLRETQLAYWSAFMGVLQGGAVRAVSPRPSMWCTFALGRTHFNLGAVVSAQHKRIQAEVYIRGETAKKWFALLLNDRAAIEAEFGEQLDWQELPEGKDSRICISMIGDPTDEADWARQHSWLAARLNRLHTVFRDRVRALPSASAAETAGAATAFDAPMAEMSE